MITTSQLLVDLRRKLGNLSESELSDDVALLLLNRSYWELLDKFPFREKEQTATFDTTNGLRNYVVPSPFEALRKLTIQDPTSLAWKVLDRQSIDEHEELRNSSDDAKGFPTHYVREKNQIRLYPVPDATYTITIKYWTTLSDLDTDPASDIQIPRNWHEMVLFGALWRGFYEELRDFNAGNHFKAQQLALINSSVPVEAKEEFDSHRAGVEILRRNYP